MVSNQEDDANLDLNCLTDCRAYIMPVAFFNVFDPITWNTFNQAEQNAPKLQFLNIKKLLEIRLLLYVTIVA